MIRLLTRACFVALVLVTITSQLITARNNKLVEIECEQKTYQQRFHDSDFVMNATVVSEPRIITERQTEVYSVTIHEILKVRELILTGDN